MPLLNDFGMDSQNLPTGQYGYSATRLENLGATEYTLVTIVADVSGSVSGFLKEMESALRAIVTACKHSPRADSLMVRLVTFDNALQELHGFKLLEQCQLNDYKNVLRSGGSTALYDATENCISAIGTYGKQLTNADFGVNGIVFVLTDGEDNASTLGPRQVRDALCRVLQEECLESLLSILIGVNVQDKRIGAYLQDFKSDVGFSQYVEIGKADAKYPCKINFRFFEFGIVPEIGFYFCTGTKVLAKLADFVSRSIFAQSQALGTGGPSQFLTF